MGDEGLLLVEPVAPEEGCGDADLRVVSEVFDCGMVLAACSGLLQEMQPWGCRRREGEGSGEEEYCCRGEVRCRGLSAGVCSLGALGYAMDCRHAARAVRRPRLLGCALCWRGLTIGLIREEAA